MEIWCMTLWAKSLHSGLFANKEEVKKETFTISKLARRSSKLKWSTWRRKWMKWTSSWTIFSSKWNKTKSLKSALTSWSLYLKSTVDLTECSSVLFKSMTPRRETNSSKKNVLMMLVTRTLKRLLNLLPSRQSNVTLWVS